MWVDDMCAEDRLRLCACVCVCVCVCVYLCCDVPDSVQNATPDLTRLPPPVVALIGTEYEQQRNAA